MSSICGFCELTIVLNEFYTIQLRILSSDMLKLTLDNYVKHPESIYYSKQYFPLKTECVCSSYLYKQVYRMSLFPILLLFEWLRVSEVARILVSTCRIKYVSIAM